MSSATAKAPDDLPQRWLARFAHLKPAIGQGACRGKAPHKPLLLLSLLDMAEAGEFKSRSFTRSPGLVLRFRSYGCITADRWPTRLDVRLPLFYLKNQSLWQAFDAEMRPAVSESACALCEMNPELYDLMADPGFRMKARMVLISRYFEPAERVALFESVGLQATEYVKRAAQRVSDEAAEAAKCKGRNARFSVRVVSEYRFTCALSGYQCMTDDSSIVDAAHIEAWALTQNDDPTNGLALSKNAHWMFDEGLWSVDDQLRVVVSKRSFSERGPESVCLRPMAGRHLQFDPTARLRPGLQFIRQHRQQHGFV